MSEQHQNPGLALIKKNVIILPVIFALLVYWILKNYADLDHTVVLGIAGFVGITDWLIMRWVVKLIESKNNTIG